MRESVITRWEAIGEKSWGIFRTMELRVKGMKSKITICREIYKDQDLKITGVCC